MNGIQVQDAPASDEPQVEPRPYLFRGERCRVTHLTDMLNYRNGPVDYRAGECIEGVVRHVEPDGFFELACDTGELRGYFLHDSTLRVELIQARCEE